MRIGVNPAKETAEIEPYGLHRVIVPIYIPNFEEYFRQSFEVLGLCLESLRLTTTGRAAVTLVANGCAPEVVAELERQRSEGWVDQLLVNRHNRGKTDAVVSVARSCYEELVTVADSDVLFRNGWVEAIEDVFRSFPECGFACPFPSVAGVWYQTSATLLAAALRGELSYDKVAADEDLDRFAHSIGRPDFFKSEYRRNQMVVRRAGKVACVGAGHFAFTLRRGVIKGMPEAPSLKACDGASDSRWLDMPPDTLGYWRLSTPQAWVNHMGNTPEEWMHEELAALKNAPQAIPAISEKPALPPAKLRWPRLLPIGLRRKMVEGAKRASKRQAFQRLLGGRLPAQGELQIAPKQ